MSPIDKLVEAVSDAKTDSPLTRSTPEIQHALDMHRLVGSMGEIGACGDDVP
ncbi:hypothetical protein GP2_055_00210 [Gordonia paraffinivorans NBRC 108238]|uniref:Uncharacterized protein n=1 Tax=Gordonia paraffinivorans NBRC 108238 TaxID=1223543 RepID=A0ABQ0IRF0_9ACTN|nr:hypothetical protein GP2_055_00210 [Gordonia paraffinivorans NBRC 108238]